ncbi:MAG: hypothetical protein LLF76_01470 [Planctomycetaceae bacterium]|nr:hypothetical protein [Planctomycetaceae bacterium]
MDDPNNEYGQPDIKIQGLSIWLHKRQFPDSTDYWDANWLDVTVSCIAEGSSVLAEGSLIHLSEITQLLPQVEKLCESLKGKAAMVCMEPVLSLEIAAKNHGQMEMTVNITPDHLHQRHTFVYEIDQSFLPSLVADCRAILAKYPIIGKP